MYMHAHNTDTCVMYLVQNETDKHVQLSDRFDFMSFFPLIQFKKKINRIMAITIDTFSWEYLN